MSPTAQQTPRRQWVVSVVIFLAILSTMLVKMQDRQLQQQRQQQQRRQQQQQHLRQEGEAVLPPPAQPSQVDPQVLFFNRIHKTGSTNFAAMMERMAGRNGFEHKRSGYYPDIKFVNRDEQQRLVDLVHQNPVRPLSYDRHVYFVDFTDFGRKNPIYFSLVREPISKYESKFYYSRNLHGAMYEKMRSRGHEWVKRLTKEEWFAKEINGCVMARDPECFLEMGQPHHERFWFDLAIPYFCGQIDECHVLGSEWALQRAKENVEKWYPVVGVLEELNSTVAVLEHLLPSFFDGFTDLYERELKEMKKNHPKKGYNHLEGEARRAVAANLTLEIGFYQHLRQRLARQVKQLP